MGARQRWSLPWGPIIVVTGLCVLFAEHHAPLFRCPACHGAHQERIRYSKAPGIAPLEAAAIRDWANEDFCRFCENSGRVPYYPSRMFRGTRPW